MNNKEFDGKIKLLKTHMVESLRTESKDFQEPRGNVPPGEIGYDEFCAILEKAGLPEMKSPVVFNIFDTGSTGATRITTKHYKKYVNSHYYRFCRYEGFLINNDCIPS